MTRVALVTLPLVVVLGLTLVPGAGAAAAPGDTADGGPGQFDALVTDTAPVDPGGSLSVRSVDTEPAEPFPGQPVRFAVTVENDGRVPVRLDDVRVLPKEVERSKYTTVEEYAAVTDLQVLAPGETATVRIDQSERDRRLNDSGINRLRVNVTGVTRADGAEENVSVSDSRLFSVDVREQPDSPSVEIDARDLSVDGGRVLVTVVNPSEVPIENVQVKLTGVPVTDTTRQVVKVPAGDSERLVFNATPGTAGDVEVTADVRFQLVDGRNAQLSQTATLGVGESDDAPPAEIVVTSTDVTADGESVQITGRLANEGGRTASGVRVELVDTDAVAGGRSYFVDGGLAADESASFEFVTAVGANASEAELRVRYRDETSGEEYTETVAVELGGVTDDETGATTAESGGGGGGLTTTLLAVAVVLGVLGLVGYGWRNRSADDDGAPVSPNLPGGVDTDRIAGAAGDLASAARDASLPTRTGQSATDGGAPVDADGASAETSQPPATPRQSTPDPDTGSATPNPNGDGTPATGQAGRHPPDQRGDAADHRERRPARDGRGHETAGSRAPEAGPVDRQPGPDSRGGPGVGGRDRGRGRQPDRGRPRGDRTARDRPDGRTPAERRAPRREPRESDRRPAPDRDPPRRERGERRPEPDRQRRARDRRGRGRDRDLPPRRDGPAERDGRGGRRSRDRRGRPEREPAPRDRREEPRGRREPPRDRRRPREQRPRGRGRERRSEPGRDAERHAPDPDPDPDPDPTAVCSGCGDTYPERALGTIALTDTDAQTCQECQLRAVRAARERLGAAGEDTGMDELVTEMSDRPTCDGCGEPTATADMKEVSLPDGSAALSCPDCRSAALSAARRQLTRHEH